MMKEDSGFIFPGKAVALVIALWCVAFLTVHSEALSTYINYQVTHLSSSSVTPSPTPGQTEKVSTAQPTQPIVLFPSPTPNIEKEVFSRVNNERTKAGLNPLKWNDEVAQSARKHSSDMAKGNYFEHQDRRGRYHDDRLNDDGFYSFSLSAENLFQGSIVDYYTTLGGLIISTSYKTKDVLVKDAVDGWMNSPGHRQNILTPDFDETGVGASVASDGETYYFTQVFIERASCGFKTGPCCVEPGYYPYCFIPLECRGSVCS